MTSADKSMSGTGTSADIRDGSLSFANSMLSVPKEVSVPNFDFSNSMFSKENKGDPVALHQQPPEYADIRAAEVLEYEKPFNHKRILTSDGHTIHLKPKHVLGEFKKDVLSEMKEDSGCGIDIGNLLDKIEYEDNLKKSAPAVEQPKKISNGVLWAEKYRPKNFLELVGNERTNRLLLRWLRRWSKCVFGEQVITDRPINSGQFPAPHQYKDPFDRPEKRILLIHGPPGIGKTTIAHVIAKQAGYEVMEINASDERAGQRVKDKIVNSLNTQTFSGKPIVLICDEVDGSTESGFIRVLVDLIQHDARATAKINNKRDGLPTKKDFNKSKSKLLMRPIICICNDLYAHSLEKLRPHSEIVSFRKSSDRTIKERLREICDREKLSVDSTELAEIVQLADCDIRSCLNLLQFSGSNGSNGDHRKKDTQINWFTIVKDIFRREPKKTKPQQYMDLHKVISANNNNDRVVNGLFSLYHDVEYQDDLMQKPNNISDWLYFFDRLSKSSFDLQNGELGSYCSEVPMKFFLSFSDPNNTNEKQLKPKSDFEHYELRRANIELQKRFMNEIAIEPRSKLILSNISTQILPFIESLLTPEIKSPRFNLKPIDRKKIDMALAILEEYGINIETRKDDSFIQYLTLYPAIDQITGFSSASRKQQQAKKSAVYPILMQEIDKVKHAKRKAAEDEAALESKVNKRAKPIEVEKKFTSTLDYFKSQYDDISNATSLKKKVRNEESRIWVKYHEGFSDAVRKNISWEDLWTF